MASIDLKDAYFLVSIAKKCKKFLRFKFEGTLFEFNCLPCGICTTPFVFTELLEPIFHHLRSLGLLSVVYIDDLLIANTEEDCLKNVERTKSLLESLEFVLNRDKCQLMPSRQCRFLGFIFDTVNYQVSLTKKKRHSILDMAQKLRTMKKYKIRDFAKFIGILAAANPAVKYGWLHTKILKRHKFLALQEANNDFDRIMTLSSSRKPDLNWWVTNIMSTTNPIEQEI